MASAKSTPKIINMIFKAFTSKLYPAEWTLIV